MTRALEVARSCRRAPTCVPRGRLCLRIWRNLTDVTQRLNKHDNGSVYMYLNRSTGEGICVDMARCLIYTTGPCSVLRRYEAAIHPRKQHMYGIAATRVTRRTPTHDPSNNNCQVRTTLGMDPARSEHACQPTGSPRMRIGAKREGFLARAARAVRDQATQSLCIGLAPLAM